MFYKIKHFFIFYIKMKVIIYFNICQCFTFANSNNFAIYSTNTTFIIFYIFQNRYNMFHYKFFNWFSAFMLV